MRVNQLSNNTVQSGEAAATRETGKANQAKSAAKKQPSGTSIDAESANANISAKGKEFARAKAIATDTPDVREEKIAELKKRIAAGRYKVDSDAVADRMVDDHMKTVLD